MGAHLLKLSKMHDWRLAHVHQEALEQDPLSVYSLMLQFVEVRSPWPDGTVFHRWNSRRGNRTDLCSNRTTVFRLQRLLDEDYRRLQRLPSVDGIPLARRIRRTRCGRPE